MEFAGTEERLAFLNYIVQLDNEKALIYGHSFLNFEDTKDKGYILKLPEEIEGEFSFSGKQTGMVSGFMSCSEAVLEVSGNLYQISEGKSF